MIEGYDDHEYENQTFHQTYWRRQRIDFKPDDKRAKLTISGAKVKHNMFICNNPACTHEILS